jgi:PTH1 family peptidyl-tRNA hydrolase
MEHLCLIVGLGNPGLEYARTRHNAGFLAVERLATRWSVPWRMRSSLQARVATRKDGARMCLLCQPQTYVNRSGEAVRALVKYYRVSLDRLLVVVDDADLPWGELRLRPQGGSAGHHGLESIEQQLGSRHYARLRIGIGRGPEPRREITGYVLGRFHAGEAKWLERVLDRAADQATCWWTAGIARAMNQFNGVVVDAENQTVA